jgi:hypothetical protein
MLSRRRFLTASLATCALPAMPGAAGPGWRPIRLGEYVTSNGVTYEAQCGAEPSAIQLSPAGIFRFSMRPGNGWPSDSSGAERVELAGWKSSLTGGRPIWAAWSMLYESDQWSTSDWCIIKQLFQRGGQPVVHVLKPGGILHWVGVDAGHTGAAWPTRHSQRIERGVWLHFVETYRFAPDTGDGYWQSWINGRQVMEYRGPLGTRGASACYSKLGVYRLMHQGWNALANRIGDRVAETVSIRYANVRWGEEDLSALAANPPADPPLEPWP